MSKNLLLVCDACEKEINKEGKRMDKVKDLLPWLFLLIVLCGWTWQNTFGNQAEETILTVKIDHLSEKVASQSDVIESMRQDWHERGGIYPPTMGTVAP